MVAVGSKAVAMYWSAFCRLIHERFGCDQHEMLIRQLFHIKQTGSVEEYVNKFAELVDQLAAYGSCTDPVYFTLRFIDGLTDDIQSIVIVYRPKDLDTTCSLTLLQEETDASRRRESRKPDSGYFSLLPKNPLPLPPPPRRDKSLGLPGTGDRRGIEAVHAPNFDEKWAGLWSSRRAK